MTTLSIRSTPKKIPLKGPSPSKEPTIVKKPALSKWKITTEYLTTSSGVEKLLLSPLDLALRWIKYGGGNLSKQIEPLHKLTGHTRVALTLASFPKQLTTFFHSDQESSVSKKSTPSVRELEITQTAIDAIDIATSACSIVEWGNESALYSLSTFGKRVCTMTGTIGSIAGIVENVLTISKESEKISKLSSSKEANESIERQKFMLSALKVTRAALSILLGVVGLASLISSSLLLLLFSTTKLSLGLGIHFCELHLNHTVAEISVNQEKPSVASKGKKSVIS